MMALWIAAALVFNTSLLYPLIGVTISLVSLVLVWLPKSIIIWIFLIKYPQKFNKFSVLAGISAAVIAQIL